MTRDVPRIYIPPEFRPRTRWQRLGDWFASAWRRVR